MKQLTQFSFFWFLAFIVTLALMVSAEKAFSSASQNATAIAEDSSESIRSFLAQIKTDARGLLGVLPQGEQVTIIHVDASAKKVFDARLDESSRATAGRELDELKATGKHTDLELALEEAVRSVSRFTGRKRIFLFTDGVPRPLQKSKFFGKSFEQILDDLSLVPNDTEVVVRLYGDEPLAITRPNIHVVRVRPNWSALVASQKNLTQPTSGKEEKTHTGHRSWVAAGVMVILVTLMGVGLIWFVNRLEEQKRKRADEEQKMKQPVRIGAESSSPQPTPEYERRFVLAIDQSGEVETLDEDRPVVVIGDRWDADRYLPECDGACARVTLVMNGRTSLVLDNCGKAAIFVGALEVPPGKRQWLPEDQIDVLIGGQILHIYQELVRTGTPEQGGEEHVRLDA